MRRAGGIGLVLAAALGVTLAGCDLATSPSPSPTFIASLAPTPTPTHKPRSTPRPTPTATPDQADVPIFEAGSLVTPTTSVRLRDLPGTEWGIAANLQLGARMQVVLGPIRTAGFAWYLVRDADKAKPRYMEGWVAAGYQPDPFLAANDTARPPANSPIFIAGYAGTKGGDFGPFRADVRTELRWTIALPIDAPAGTTCRFTGTLSREGGEQVTFLNTSAAQAPAPGTVQPSFFVEHPKARGNVILHVDSDCSWAVSVLRLPIQIR